MIRREKKGKDGKIIIELIPETPEEEQQLMEMVLRDEVDGRDSFSDEPEDDIEPES